MELGPRNIANQGGQRAFRDHVAWTLTRESHYTAQKQQDLKALKRDERHISKNKGRTDNRFYRGRNPLASGTKMFIAPEVPQEVVTMEARIAQILEERRRGLNCSTTDQELRKLQKTIRTILRGQKGGAYDIR